MHVVGDSTRFSDQTIRRGVVVVLQHGHEQNEVEGAIAKWKRCTSTAHEQSLGP